MNDQISDWIAQQDARRHVIIAGPTASGKSALALALARAQGGVIVNADALQIWSCWRVLTARPDPADEAAAPHALYGHVDAGEAYSVGEWLRDIAPLLSRARCIIVGGTGLYLSALTEGLAEIPQIDPIWRARSEELLQSDGLAAMIAQLDPASAAKIDLANPVRVQRAWEVRHATGRGLADWQADTPPPLLPASAASCLVLTPERTALAQRIAQRFEIMLSQGALDEVRANLSHWQDGAQWTRAIGAPALREHLEGRLSLPDAIESSVVATRQYAKQQRSWFRNRMKDWPQINPLAEQG